MLIEALPDETRVPKDLLLFINQLHLEAMKGIVYIPRQIICKSYTSPRNYVYAGNTVSELGFLIYQGGNFLDSREHAGFLFIRQTSQCLQKIILPPAPYLIGLLVHRFVPLRIIKLFNNKIWSERCRKVH